MNSPLAQFYLIVDSSRWLERLLPCGVKLVQLRAKNLPESELYQEVKKSKSLCENYNSQLIINDHWKLAIDSGCNYIHLGQEDLDNADMPAIRRADLKLGISTHNEAELDRALTFDPDYIALGPIYPTILKQMPWAPQGLERISKWKKKIADIPLVAIGGLNIERAPGVVAAGADSLAVVTDITLNNDPEARVREWLKLPDFGLNI